MAVDIVAADVAVDVACCIDMVVVVDVVEVVVADAYFETAVDGIDTVEGGVDETARFHSHGTRDTRQCVGRSLESRHLLAAAGGFEMLQHPFPGINGMVRLLLPYSPSSPLGCAADAAGDDGDDAVVAAAVVVAVVVALVLAATPTGVASSRSRAVVSF